MKKYLRGKEVEVLKKLQIGNTSYCIVQGEWDLQVVPATDIQDYEDTRQYRLEKQIKELEKQKEKKVKEIQDKAIKTIISRIKLNVAFSDIGKYSAVAMGLAEELEKIIKDQ